MTGEGVPQLQRRFWRGSPGKTLDPKAQSQLMRGTAIACAGHWNRAIAHEQRLARRCRRNMSQSILTKHCERLER